VKVDELALSLTLESLPRQLLPPNCELLSRLYVGDLEYALAREPRNRELFLVAQGIAWRLNVPALLALFADELRAWDRQRELMLQLAQPRLERPPRLVKRKKAS
jgi:hypothetical protein